MKLSLNFFEAVEVATALQRYAKFCKRNKCDRSLETVRAILSDLGVPEESKAPKKSRARSR